MQKQNFFLFLPIVFLSLFVSCKKDDGPAPPGNGNRIKIYIEDASLTPYNRIDTFNISYDASGRITSLASTKGGQFVYTYNTGNFVMDIKNNGNLIIREYFYLNNNQLIDSNFQYNDTGDSSTEKLIYNTANQLTQMKRYDYSLLTGSSLFQITNYTYDNAGNLSSETRGDETGTIYSVTTYTHNSVLNDVFGFNLPYYPTLHKYLITTKTQGSSYVNYEYTYDNLNRVVTEKDTDNNGYVVVKKYIYE